MQSVVFHGDLIYFLNFITVIDWWIIPFFHLVTFFRGVTVMCFDMSAPVSWLPTKQKKKEREKKERGREENKEKNTEKKRRNERTKERTIK